MNVNFPFRIDPGGRTAQTDYAAHIEQLMQQLIFTAPGERVNRPEFGSGVGRLVFAANSAELAAAIQYQLQGNLQQAFEGLVQIQAVTINADADLLAVDVQYLLVDANEPRRARFTHPTPS